MIAMAHDGWFFVGVFVFIFLIWVATGGPTHPLSFTGPTLAQPGPLGGGTYLSLPRAMFGIGSSTASLSGTSDGSSADSKPMPSLEGVAFGPPSVYRAQISMSHYVSGAESSNPADEYLTLSLSQNATGPVTLSGWTLLSAASRKSAMISGGTEVPVSGAVNANVPIVLKPGDRALIISGRSPIGDSFRENKCTGYLNQFQKFSPPLPNSCPTPDSELATYYGPDYIRDARCIDYVRTLPRCHAVLTPEADLTRTCLNFLTHYLTYNSCVNVHNGDQNFTGTTWRIYLGRTTPLWRQRHEVVKLLDSENKTVDAFSY